MKISDEERQKYIDFVNQFTEEIICSYEAWLFSGQESASNNAIREFIKFAIKEKKESLEVKRVGNWSYLHGYDE